MSFIKIYPLKEAADASEETFGRGHPARCPAEHSFTAREYWLNLHEIVAFEECPLYLVCEAEPNGLVNGLRMRLRSGETILVPDDAPEGEPDFLEVLARAARGEVVEMSYSAYLKELEQQKLI